jgi:hypothetical protein
MSQIPASDHSSTQIRDDILLIVGGNFTPAAISPPAYETIVTRVREHANEYINEFESLFLDNNLDTSIQSRLLLPVFLKIVADLFPERVRTIADQLLRHYDTFLIEPEQSTERRSVSEASEVSEETMRLSQRLEGRRAELQAFLQ